MKDTAISSRQFSLGVTMQAVLHSGPISRASIAKQTGLSKQTISEVVRSLEEDGWIRETGRTSGHVGRSAVTYKMIADAACIAAVDLGGTKVRVAITDLAGTSIAERVEPTDPEGGEAVITQIARLCREAAGGGGIDFAKVKLAVVGVPGAPDDLTGHVDLAPNIAGLDRFDVRAALRTALGIEALVENDVNLAAIGEHWIGRGAGIDDMVYIALGTGIGAGIIVQSELVRGARHGAGELGFLPFGADPFEPESLRVGALERTVATQGMKARYRSASGKALDVPAIFDRAAGGDPDAVAVLDETARQMARTVAAICALVDPALIVLGGSIGSRSEMAERVRAEVSRCFPHPIAIEVTALGTHAALAGAAAIGLTELHTALFAGGMSGIPVALPAPGLVSFLEVLP